MAFNFKKSAQESTTLSELMTGRDKMDTDEFIERFPDGATIVNFDMVVSQKAEYPVFVLAEDKSKFYCGGLILKKIVQGWLRNFGDDIETANDELEKSGGVKVKLSMGKTAEKNQLVKVEIL